MDFLVGLLKLYILQQQRGLAFSTIKIGRCHHMILFTHFGMLTTRVYYLPIQTPNPAWPPPLHFLPSQPERMKDLSVKSWSAIAGSGPVPWRQAPSLFNSSSIQASVQLRMPMPFETDVSGGIDRCSLYERLSMTSPEKKLEQSYERLANGKLRLGPSGTLHNGSIGNFFTYLKMKRF